MIYHIPYTLDADSFMTWFASRSGVGDRLRRASERNVERDANVTARFEKYKKKNRVEGCFSSASLFDESLEVVNR